MVLPVRRCGGYHSAISCAACVAYDMLDRVSDELPEDCAACAEKPLDERVNILRGQRDVALEVVQELRQRLGE